MIDREDQPSRPTLTRSLGWDRCRRPVLLLLLAIAASAPFALARPQGARAALASCGSPTVEMSSSLPLLQQPAVASAVQSTIDQLAAARDADQVPGFSVVVVHDQDVVFSAGFGCADLVKQTPVTPETPFVQNSITKLFTAVMLMQLRDAGSLSLDDPASRYVTSAQYLSPEGQLVSPTLRQLADHSSGLERNMRPAPGTIDELFQRLQTEKAAFDPGSSFLYSNLGYAVLGQVLAQVAGQPYDQYITQQILQPLGMTASDFGPTSDLVAQLATGYSPAAAGSQVVLAPGSPLPFGGVSDPAGGLVSNADDMAHFLSLQFAANSPVLAASSVAEMYQPILPATDSGSGPAPLGAEQGIGWVNLTGNRVPWMYKEGLSAGFNSYAAVLQNSKVGVAVMVNEGDPKSAAEEESTKLGSLVLNNLAATIRTNTP